MRDGMRYALPPVDQVNAHLQCRLNLKSNDHTIEANHGFDFNLHAATAAFIDFRRI